jgi:hypothetical protein
MKTVAFRTCLLALAVLTLVLVISYWPQNDSRTPQLRSPPDIPELDLSGLLKLPPAELLNRVELESTRRVLVSDQGWRSGPSVLSTSASVIWVTGLMESAILHHGFGSLVMSERNPVLTPQIPSLSQAADAYAALGLQPVSEVVHQAAALAAGSESVASEDYAALDERFRRALGKGSQATRLMYAKRNVSALFP